MLNSSAIGTTNRNLLAVLGDGLRIPARFRAGENGTPSAKVGSSKEGDPGKLGSCDDYWQRGFCSLPTRPSSGVVSMPSSWTRQFALAYAWHGRLYGDIAEFNASADYSRKAHELRERRSEPEKYFITAHFHIAVGQRPIPGRGCHIISCRGSAIRSWGGMRNLVRKAKKQLGCLRTTPSPRRPSRIATLV
jgi:hypothetical protein